MRTEIPNVIAFSSGDNPPGCDNPGQKQIAGSEAPGRGQTILVVDDSLAWLRLARDILTAGGYQVQTCEHPRDALLLLKQNPEQIDLVITDLQMPCLDGIELASRTPENQCYSACRAHQRGHVSNALRETSVFRNSRFPDQALGP